MGLQDLEHGQHRPAIAAPQGGPAPALGRPRILAPEEFPQAHPRDQPRKPEEVEELPVPGDDLAVFVQNDEVAFDRVQEHLDQRVFGQRLGLTPPFLIRGPFGRSKPSFHERPLTKV